MTDTQVTDENDDEMTEIEVITADETTHEFELGEAPHDEDEEEDAMEDVDDDGRILAEDADVRDDAEMVFNKHSGPVYSIKVNPVDPRIVITGGGDDVGVIWNREDGNVLYTLSGHQDSVVSVDFSFDGKYAATGGYDGVVKVWEVATGNMVQNLEGPSQEVEWVCWHKKGNVVLAGSSDGTVWMWLATTGECMHVFAGHEDGVTCGAFTGSGKLIVTGSSDTTVRVWNPKTGECNHVFRGHGFHEGPVTFITCHPSQPLAICGSQDGTARLIQVQTKRVLAALSHDGAGVGIIGIVNDASSATENSVECGGFCHTMNWAATGCLGGYLRIWDLVTYQCRHVCRHPAGVIKLLWHPSQPIVYSCTVEGLLYVWDARTGQLLKTLAGHTDMILDVALVPAVEGNSVAELLTASDDESVRLFCVEN
uniref:Angio-associated migratory cell protein n=1 Tax=Peronospora matthiolae TaxID=2874970 RepID=A0AAV1UGS8_9STRA